MVIFNKFVTPQSHCKEFYNHHIFTVKKSLAPVVWDPSKDKAVLEPRVSPAFAITYLCKHCNIRFENTSKYEDTLTLFSKNLNQRSLTPRWPLTPYLLRSHVWLYPRIIVSKSHGNTSMWIQWSIFQITTYIHIHTYYVQNEWSHSLLLNSVQARQKWQPPKAEAVKILQCKQSKFWKLKMFFSFCPCN